MDAGLLTLCFAMLLVIGVLISELANRTVLSTAVLFLLGGFLLGPGALNVLHIEAGDRVSPCWPSWRCSPCCTATG